MDNLKAIIWGCCGSLPSPSTSADIRGKVREALWAARDRSFATRDEVEAFIDSLPHSAAGTYRANTSCVQIVHPGEEAILCDAGTGIRDYALTLDPAAGRSYHILVSHLHWDHIQGFPFFMPAYYPGNRIVFHGFHPSIEAAIRRQMDAPWFPVPFEAMRAEIEFDVLEDGAEFQVEDVRVRTIKQQHPGDSWGYRFEREGKSIVYSSDSEHGPESRNDDYPFIRFFEGADVLIFDGQYTFEQALNEKRHWGHSDHSTAVELAARAKVRKLAVFHHEPAHSDREIEAMHRASLDHRARFNATLRADGPLFPESVLLAYDGLEIEA